MNDEKPWTANALTVSERAKRAVHHLWTFRNKKQLPEACQVVEEAIEAAIANVAAERDDWHRAWITATTHPDDMAARDIIRRASEAFKNGDLVPDWVQSLIDKAVADASPKWISVAERLPSVGQDTLITFRYPEREPYIGVMQYHSVGASDEDADPRPKWADLNPDGDIADFYFPTHWMPLPAPPTEDAP